MNLTKSQEQSITWCAEYARQLGGTVKLYKSTSQSGLSETLRYKVEYVDSYYRILRYKTGLILSVTFKVLADGSDDPKSWEKYNQLCIDAENFLLQLLNKAIQAMKITIELNDKFIKCMKEYIKNTIENLEKTIFLL